MTTIEIEGAPNTRARLVQAAELQERDRVLIRGVGGSRIQGNGAATPIPGELVEIEGVVVGDHEGPSTLLGFMVQEEDADVDADPATSEGIFVFHNDASDLVNLGDAVRVQRAVQSHESILESIRWQDADRARVEMEAHLRYSAGRILQMTSDK